MCESYGLLPFPTILSRFLHRYPLLLAPHPRIQTELVCARSLSLSFPLFPFSPQHLSRTVPTNAREPRTTLFLLSTLGKTIDTKRAFFMLYSPLLSLSLSHILSLSLFLLVSLGMISINIISIKIWKVYVV